MTTTQKFSELVEEATGLFSDLERSIKGLLLYAEENATEEEKEIFLEWLGNRRMFGTLYEGNTTPFDHFPCAEGKTWDEMEEVYETA